MNAHRCCGKSIIGPIASKEVTWKVRRTRAGIVIETDEKEVVGKGKMP